MKYEEINNYNSFDSNKNLKTQEQNCDINKKDIKRSKNMESSVDLRNIMEGSHLNTEEI